MSSVLNPSSEDELVELFASCVNWIQPPHPYQSDPYPITTDEVRVGWCHSNGPYWAKCGPERFQYVTLFKPNTSSLLSMSTEKLLAVLTHEVTHISEGHHTEGGGHNKPFWREMAFSAWQMRENCELIGDSGPISDEAYVTEIVTEPNSFTVDYRIETMAERREKMADLLGVTYQDGDVVF